MVKHEEVSQDKIHNILKELVGKGEVFASCPHCSQYISFNEKELLFCNNCKTKLKKEEILYSYNKAVGQNN